MALIKDSTYSTTSGGQLLVTLPQFTGLVWQQDSVEITADGELEETGSCSDRTWTFEKGHLIVEGDVRIAASAALPCKGGHVTDGDGRHWLVQDSSISETFACKPCLGRLSLKWDQDFHAAVVAGDYSVTSMTDPPLASSFSVPA